MEQFNKYRSPIVLGVLIMFLLLFVFFMLGIQPTNKVITSQNAQIEQLEKETNIIQTKINELKGTADSNNTNSEQEKLLAALPKGDDSEGLIVDLQAVGLSSQVRLRDISFVMNIANPIQEMADSGDVLIPTVKQLSMLAVVEGTYTSIKEWMDQLQALPRIVNVDSFNFQQSYGQGTGRIPEEILTANVSFTAYYEGAPAAQTTQP